MTIINRTGNKGDPVSCLFLGYFLESRTSNCLFGRTDGRTYGGMDEQVIHRINMLQVRVRVRVPAGRLPRLGRHHRPAQEDGLP